MVAVERDFSEPMLVKEPVLYIEGGRNLVFSVSLNAESIASHHTGGRHPLCECVVGTFVPNDTVLDAKSNTEEVLSIITGPNYSGKSVYLKQCAL
jgi:hypothetical protein